VKKKFIQVCFPDSILTPIRKGHPWGFSKKFSPFLKELKPGSWIQIQNSHKKTIGYGIYTSGELSILKIFWHGEDFDLKLLLQRLHSRLSLREPLWKITNSIRLIHGENDYIPGITIDFHEKVLVTRVYSPYLISIARFLQRYVIQFLSSKLDPSSLSCYLQIPNRISGNWNYKKKFQVWRGKLFSKLKIYQDEIDYLINPTFQKGGIYNDIRNLRTYLLENKEKLTGKVALNLFSNNGFLSKVLEKIGYSEIDSLEYNSNLIENAKENLNPKIHNIVQLDIFKNLSSFLELNKKIYDLIIIDPPSLTSKQKDKPKAREIYQKLISCCLPYLKENGFLILCSCSNRIHPQDFERISLETFKKNMVYVKLIEKLKPELDHPTIQEFPEGNYFKVFIYKKGQKI